MWSLRSLRDPCECIEWEAPEKAALDLKVHEEKCSFTAEKMVVLFLGQSNCTRHIGVAGSTGEGEKFEGNDQERLRQVSLTLKLGCPTFLSTSQLMLSSVWTYRSSLITLGRLPPTTSSLKDLTSFFLLFPSRSYMFFSLLLFVCLIIAPIVLPWSGFGSNLFSVLGTS